MNDDKIEIETNKETRRIKENGTLSLTLACYHLIKARSLVIKEKLALAVATVMRPINTKLASRQIFLIPITSERQRPSSILRLIANMFILLVACIETSKTKKKKKQKNLIQRNTPSSILEQ